MTDPRPAENPESLLAIDAPHFYGGVLLNNDRVSRAAPIVRYMLGWSAQRLTRYCQGRGWRVVAVSLNGGRDETNGSSHFDDANGDDAHRDGG